MPIVHGDRSGRQRKVEAAAREDQAVNVGGSRIGRRDREALVAIAAGSRDVPPESPAVGAVAGRPESPKESLEDRAAQVGEAAADRRAADERVAGRILAMIVHVVLLKPKPELTDEQRRAIVADLRLAATAIPSVRRLRVGKRVRHGRPGYEQLMAQDFEYAVLIEFDDVEGLVAYLAHPQHAAIGMHFVQSAAAALAYDYEIEE